MINKKPVNSLSDILGELTAVKCTVCDVPEGKEHVVRVTIKMDKLISLHMISFIIFLIFQNLFFRLCVDHFFGSLLR